MAFFLCLVCARATLAAAITFPLEAKWSVTLPASPAFAPAFDSDYLYVAMRTNELVALLLSDGTEVWWVECPMTAPPVAGGGHVYIGNDGSIEARAQLDGHVDWRRPVQGRVISLHWDAGWLFAQTEMGPLLAIRAADGEILWQKDFGSPLAPPPAPAGDRLYVGLNDGRVVALTLLTGEEIWTHKLAEPAVGILPVGNRVFVGARDNQFHSLSADNADTDWHWRTGADVLGLPVLDSRRVYFIALDNILRGHNRNSGSMEWKRVLPVRPFTGPLLSGDTLIVSGVAAQLYAYSALDGNPTGSHEVKGAENEEMLLAAPPHLTADDSLILVTKGGHVRALGSPTIPLEPPAAAPDSAPSPGAAGPAAAPESAPSSGPAGPSDAPDAATPPETSPPAPEPDAGAAGAATPPEP